MFISNFFKVDNLKISKFDTFEEYVKDLITKSGALAIKSSQPSGLSTPMSQESQNLEATMNVRFKDM